MPLPEKKINPIHADPTVQHVDVRLYFDKDEYHHEDLLDKISDALQNAPELSCLISAYEMKNIEYVFPPDSAPLA